MEIGSFFEFPKYDGIDFENSAYHHIKGNISTQQLDSIFVGDGRQAIKLLLEELIKKNHSEFYLPAYLCHSIIQPFAELNIEFKFYSCDEKLKPDLRNIPENSVVYLIDYFGSDSLSKKEILEISKKNIVILDISHSILNKERLEILDKNVFMIASLRKIFPIPDGGILFYKKGILNMEKRVFEKNNNYIEMLEAMVLKKYYMNKSNSETSLKNYFLELYRNYEFLKDGLITVKEIPPISMEILKNIDIKKMKTQRTVNLEYIYDNLNNPNVNTIYEKKELKSPFFIPLNFENGEIKERIRKKLIENQIYPPIHWEIPKEVPKNFTFEHALSENILSVPIDHRYCQKDMEKILGILNGE
ncbi:hypothetical protein MmarC5_0505 [Methanococcus maripaludis C5]|uniref:DegT/DnrJ/EryC1/StrS aminotransferase family protein n=1 Tax=Methanococcus maripaludis (strain C5 / ATCC BAA-1333) TaxID=402880 RepID=A4FX90_METM5|nr:hypothetical protein [Methanococcus maripaludis]ABO34819.1 hypothetical protein MmarC5_0505 [Methanococcus maripaludis C5]